MVERVSRCSLCGGVLTAGRCLACDFRRWSGFVHRELVLLVVLVGVTVVAFLVTRSVAASNDVLRLRQAAVWFESAQDDLRRGEIEPAVVMLRRAVSKDPDNRQYRLALAGALSASDLSDEARRVLLALRDVQPEDPEANLQLARLESRGADPDAARRYYQSALAGLWRPEDAAERRRVRLELIDFLLTYREDARALSELLAVEANLPDDVAVQVQVGRLYLDAGDARRALTHFTSALEAEPGHGGALAGAGESAFELEDYASAVRYLAAAPQDDERVGELREVAGLVLSADPLAPRVGVNERRRRLVAAFGQAQGSLEACLHDPSVPSRPTLESLRAEADTLATTLAARPRGDQRDLVDDGVDLIYRIEQSIEQNCRTPRRPLDRALLLIGRRRGFGEQ